MSKKSNPTNVTRSIKNCKGLSRIPKAEEEQIMATKRGRALKITIANLSKSDQICVTNWFFSKGKAHNQPVDTIPPGHKQIIYVHSRHGPLGKPIGGVSGGFAVFINAKNMPDCYLLCSFSNPWIGCIKVLFRKLDSHVLKDKIKN